MGRQNVAGGQAGDISFIKSARPLPASHTWAFMFRAHGPPVHWGFQRVWGAEDCQQPGTSSGPGLAKPTSEGTRCRELWDTWRQSAQLCGDTAHIQHVDTNTRARVPPEGGCLAGGWETTDQGERETMVASRSTGKGWTVVLGLLGHHPSGSHPTPLATVNSKWVRELHGKDATLRELEKTRRITRRAQGEK